MQDRYVNIYSTKDAPPEIFVDTNKSYWPFMKKESHAKKKWPFSSFKILSIFVNSILKFKMHRIQSSLNETKKEN